MATYQISAPDGSKYEITAPDSASQSDVLAYAQAHHVASAAPSGPPPTEGQSWLSSPGGRGLRSIADTAIDFGSQLPSVVTMAGLHMALPASLSQAINAGAQSIKGFVDQPFDAANAAARNTPGYAKAAALASHATAPGFTGMLLPDMRTGVSGLIGSGMQAVGLGAPGATSADMFNATVDSQAAQNQQYRQANPISSNVAGLAGSLLTIPAGSGAGSVIGRAAEAAQPTKALASLPSAQRAAAQYIQDLTARAGATPSSLDAAQAAAGGKDITAAEAIGKPGEVAAGALARRQGATANTMASTIGLRSASAPSRILDDLASASGIDPAAAQGNIDDLVAKGRETASPLYKGALSQPGGIWNDDLARLAQRPVIKKALAAASEDLLNADKSPSAVGLTFDEAGNLTVNSHPTAEAWDLVKKNVGGQVERDMLGRPLPDSVSPKNHNIGVANRDLAAAMRDAIPGYGDALDVSGDYLSAQKAFKDGQTFILNPKVTPAQLADHLSSLSDAEVQAFKGGVANKLFDQAQNARLGPKLFDVPKVQAKLSAVLGEDNAAKFLQNMQTEKSMAQFASKRVPGAGSPTAEYNEEMSQQDAPFGTQAFDKALKYGTTVATRGAGAGAMHVLSDVAKNAAASWQTRGMPVPVRDEAGKLLLMSPSDLASFLRLIEKPGAPMRLTRPINLPVSLIGSSIAAQKMQASQ